MLNWFIIRMLCRTLSDVCGGLCTQHFMSNYHQPTQGLFSHCHQYSKQKVLVTVSDITNLKLLSKVYVLQLSISGVVSFFRFLQWCMRYSFFWDVMLSYWMFGSWHFKSVNFFFNPLRWDHYIFTKCWKLSTPQENHCFLKKWILFHTLTLWRQNFL